MLYKAVNFTEKKVYLYLCIFTSLMFNISSRIYPKISKFYCYFLINTSYELFALKLRNLFLITILVIYCCCRHMKTYRVEMSRHWNRTNLEYFTSVSYTHLDVYKRQLKLCTFPCILFTFLCTLDNCINN